MRDAPETQERADVRARLRRLGRRGASILGLLLAVAVVAAFALLLGLQRPGLATTALRGSPPGTSLGAGALATDTPVDTPTATPADTPLPTATAAATATFFVPPTATPSPIAVTFSCGAAHARVGDPQTYDAQVCAQAPAEVDAYVTIALTYCGVASGTSISFHLAGGAMDKGIWSFHAPACAPPFAVAYDVATPGFAGGGSITVGG